MATTMIRIPTGSPSSSGSEPGGRYRWMDKARPDRKSRRRPVKVLGVHDRFR